MRKLLLLLTLLLAPLAYGVNGNTLTIRFAGVPTGTCASYMFGVNNATSDYYGCTSAGAWILIAAGGGSTGTVTSFSAGTLSPLFTTSVATATTTPALSFALSNAAAHTFFGNNTGSTAAPAFAAITSADLPAGTGTVTSVATTSPIAGGTITATGTITCTTCVVASSPGVGIAHFAGSTQTVTSSAVDVSGADATGVLAAGRFPALTGFTTTASGALATSPGKADVTQTQNFCSDAGSTDSYACNLTPAITTYVTGTIYNFFANTVNTGTASINFNSLGAKTIVKNVSGTLANGDITASKIVSVMYDGTNMQMLNPLGNNVGVSFPLSISALNNITAPQAIPQANSSNLIRSTGLTGAVSTATLCAASTNNCNTAGQYHVHWTFYESGTACGTPGTGGVTFLLTWTDANATAHTAISLPMDDGTSLVATSATFHFQTSLGAAWASGDFNVDTNGTIIQYATGYTACSVGTGTYALSAVVTKLQ